MKIKGSGLVPLLPYTYTYRSGGLLPLLPYTYTYWSDGPVPYSPQTYRCDSSNTSNSCYFRYISELNKYCTQSYM